MKKTLKDGRVLEVREGSAIYLDGKFIRISNAPVALKSAIGDVTHKMLIEFNVTRVFVGLTTAESEEINADMAVCEEAAKKAAKLSDALEVKAIKFDNAHNEGVIGGGYNPYR